jgi:hypothetical protein
MRTLFSIHNRVWFVFVVLMIDQIGSLIFGGIPDFGRTPYRLVYLIVLALYSLAIVALLTCWFEFFRRLMLSRGMASKERLLWSVCILFAPYGLLAFYYLIYRKRLLEA